MTGRAVSIVAAVRTIRLRAVAIAVAIVLAQATTVGAETRVVTAPSDRFCAAFAEYETANIAILFGVVDFGKLEDREKPFAVFGNIVAASPKFAELAAEMAKSAPAVLREKFQAERELYDAGVEVLRDAGVSRREIAAIADADFNSDGLERTIGEAISRKELLSAGRRLVEQHRAEILALRRDTSGVEKRASAKAEVECGVVPDRSVRCRDLVSRDELAAIFGGTSTLESEDGCAWSADVGDEGGGGRLFVGLFASPRHFETFGKQASGAEPISMLGDEAVAIPGYQAVSSPGSFTTSFNVDPENPQCGYTVVVRSESQSLHVAECLFDRDVTAEEVAAVARQILASP